MRRLFFVLVLFVSCATVAQADFLHYVSDLISTSAPSTGANHTIQFTLTNAVPPSGRIVLTPQSGAFTIPADFDYTDVDVAVWNGSSYVNQPVAAAADASNVGVSVVTGTSGSVTITLSSSAGLLAGDKVQILLGTNAVFGALGSDSIVNPSAPGSYRIEMDTQSDVGVPIDGQSDIVAIVAPVGLVFPLRNTPPGISNGLPSGELAAGNPVIELSFDTDRTATCRYATTTNVAYTDMTGTFSSSGGVFFYTDLSGFQDGTSYNFYVRCIGVQGAVDTDDYPISFFLDPTPSSNSSVAQSGGGVSGVGPYPNGSSVLYLAGVTLTGITSPGSSVVVLNDGKQALVTQSGGDGSFRADVTGLERGTYTFAIYSTDTRQRKSSSYSSTLTLNAAANDQLSNIVLPPTIALANDSVAAGAGASIVGAAAPGSIINVFVVPQSGGTPQQFNASTTASGQWEVDTAGRAG